MSNMNKKPAIKKKLTKLEKAAKYKQQSFVAHFLSLKGWRDPDVIYMTQKHQKTTIASN